MFGNTADDIYIFFTVSMNFCLMINHDHDCSIIFANRRPKWKLRIKISVIPKSCIFIIKHNDFILLSFYPWSWGTSSLFFESYISALWGVRLGMVGGQEDGFGNLFLFTVCLPLFRSVPPNAGLRKPLRRGCGNHLWRGSLFCESHLSPVSCLPRQCLWRVSMRFVPHTK